MDGKEAAAAKIDTKDKPATKQSEKVSEQCSKCNTDLLKREYESREETHECSACRLGVFARSCGCEYTWVKIITKACPSCDLCLRHDSPPKWNGARKKFECTVCREEKEEEEKKRRQEEEIIRQERERVEAQRRKMEFCNKWKENPLSCYGLNKLKKLASKKKLVGRSTMSKEELIVNLKPLLISGDLPIR